VHAVEICLEANTDNLYRTKESKNIRLFVHKINIMSHQVKGKRRSEIRIETTKILTAGLIL
jgi:hypothetical protein